MNRILCMLLCLCVVLVAFSTEVFALKLNAEDVDWGLNLMAEAVSPTGMVVIVTQSGGSYGGDLEYGSHYWLEVWSGNTWEYVPYIRENVGWTLEAYGLPAESVSRMEHNWEWLYGELSPGRYRFGKQFTDFRHGGDGYDDADFYVEFVITDPHTCASKDEDLLCDLCLGLAPHGCPDENGDAECDICGTRVSEKDIYRVIGNADWMGKWEPGSNKGLMKEAEPGVYDVEFKDVPAGEYSLMITRNGAWENAIGDVDDSYDFTVPQTMDLHIQLTLRDGEAQVHAYGPGYEGETATWQQERSAETGDPVIDLAAAMLLICAAVLPLLLRKRGWMA